MKAFRCNTYRTQAMEVVAFTVSWKASRTAIYPGDVSQSQHMLMTTVEREERVKSVAVIQPLANEQGNRGKARALQHAFLSNGTHS